jgi:anthranilate synthase/aminodeoxychorismate synthase-like glutamine amidotransferase
VTFAGLRGPVVVIDNYDSFTYNVVQSLGGLGAPCHVLLNDRTSLAAIEALAPSGIVISPGPGTPDESGISLPAIAHFAGKVPVLGVCLGHQAIGQHFGAQVVLGQRPVHGKPRAIAHDGRGIFAGLVPSVRMGCYNSLVVDAASVPAELEVSARAENGEVMALRHRRWALDGVQFHPESVLSEGGLQLFANWLEQIGLVSGRALPETNAGAAAPASRARWRPSPDPPTLEREAEA